MGIYKQPTIYKCSLSEKEVLEISNFHFERCFLKVNNFSKNKISHDNDDFVIGVDPNERTLYFDYDKEHKICTFGGYFNCTSNLSITAGTYTEVFTGELNENINAMIRTLFFDKTSNVFYPCYVVINNGNISARFARTINASFIDVLNMLTNI